MKSILDPKDSTGEFPFKWVSADQTDIRETFARIKKAAPQAPGMATSGNDAEADSPTRTAGLESATSASAKPVVAAPILRRAK